ncbi:MAG TPA: metal-dependent hydrolase [Candidatus Paceibacterota bacterium]|nr:metal-dependent hydrolase [Candidatus Paceibacterota bacterium]HMO82537.1 metal-dependent hydrolase [Candidatus Paceibacterota bacterium]
MKNILAILADVANGIFATIAAGLIVGVDPSWHFIVGIALAMSPDLDALPELFRRGKVASSVKHVYDHREGLHFPIIFILVGIILINFYPFWGWLFLIATMLHFINDLYGTGWGIPLLWPLTRRRYKLLGRRANLLKKILKEKGFYETESHDETKLRLLVSWSQAELSSYIKKYGIEDWVERYYLKLNWISGIEYSIFLGAIVLILIL